MRAGLIQLSVGDDPAQNLAQTLPLLRDAAADGAGFLLTPEVTNCITPSAARRAEVLRHEADDPTLDALRNEAARLGVWLSIGSISVKTDEARYANRSFMIDPTGRIVARYDKIHMFDVTVSASEVYRESATFRPGDTVVLVETPFGKVGVTICYDVRFPDLYRSLAQAGADILLVPAAFTPATGAAHWHTLLRARAIENGAYVLAAAQTGTHPSTVPVDQPRRTYGHTLAVSPWGEVLVDAGEAVGFTCVDLDLAAVADARARIPALTHDRPYTLDIKS